MARDYFTILGLVPGHYDRAEIERRFLAERHRLLDGLDQAGMHVTARRGLDELHLAYAALREPSGQAAYLRTLDGDDDRVGALRQRIGASLEDGLLRYSRRQDILDDARRLGISEFHAHLLIAQVQFGEALDLGRGTPASSRPVAASRTWAQVAAILILALAIFLLLMHFFGA